ncbi:DNA cytosine methyltransferase [Bradyrhizobium elkanii]|jgi:DNA (cytosine-5)-methyltransferase 1|uniref:DNA cytosine methyltransferase n=1 Tax=Bradyrhizobium elkanii TaxID=29448 RepID=UPI00155A3141|nr:DNA cytosine methyltransferase [Bradyrhizobium elkanii]MCP1927712.1 DNA (cytosine-5)-methyltransferase 1 [Bradyrhizobium elkanii]MCS3581679.1 DNA (cytosine-5)-methyltransferase 1 [Bradyrhizobium elkanii]MCS3724553.1 DNA (cytosine-5)-methyltransferase 1 [Bradyrhizobium elkanii]MCS4008965.1 DNA (cytosine-5)-methyltransferase 1 [Bradyrhizobium elkanii USDA 61]WLA40779.1 DNA cytosine methyltransferase [Bradyrhizobium elkanii]
MELKENIQAVDLFCGAAGLSLGLKRSGINIVAGIDLDPACQYPFEQNIGSPFLQLDVQSLTDSKVADLFSSEIRVLAGCAPCQPFSGYTTRRRAIDKRWQLLLEFLRIAEGVKPEIVTLENVPRLAHLPLWTMFVSRLEMAGYHVTWAVLDAAQYGVPQNRRRLVLLGSRLGKIDLPKPNKTSRTVRSAIGNLSRIPAGKKNEADPLHAARALTARNLARIRIARPAGTWKEWPKNMRAACHTTESGRTYPSVYGRMSWDKPAPTITTQFYGFGNGRFGHPEQDRAITLREGSLLQSFPKSFKFAAEGSRVNFRAIGRLIGNAVPPALGQAIGKAIVDHVCQRR